MEDARDSGQAQERRRRLAEALRENLRRRKARARSLPDPAEAPAPDAAGGDTGQDAP
jgi:hypothetical protein